ncbi:hypothetical protein HK101_006733, partial [Irineochytrium annulatum]
MEATAAEVPKGLDEVDDDDDEDDEDYVDEGEEDDDEDDEDDEDEDDDGIEFSEIEGEVIDDEDETGDEEGTSRIHMSNAWRRNKGAAKITGDPSRIQILTCDELLDRISTLCPAPLRPDSRDGKVTVGFVGYPNVGKSSTLNALAGAKLVTVSSTPGKTKHFQTIHLDEKTVLCDCPGLVFPSFATTKAEMVVNGILPIDQLREHTGPSTLVASRIPRTALEIIYGVRIRTVDEEGNPDASRVPTGEDLCQAYAVARGFKKAGQGNPDESRAARIILKEYVQGKLLYCLPPPGHDAAAFNADTYSSPEYQRPKRQARTHEIITPEGVLSRADLAAPTSKSATSTTQRASDAMDAAFFRAPKTSGAMMKGKNGAKGEFTRAMMYPHQVGAVASAGET